MYLFTHLSKDDKGGYDGATEDIGLCSINFYLLPHKLSFTHAIKNSLKNGNTNVIELLGLYYFDNS